MTRGLPNSQQQGFKQMDCALNAGINFFDTAEMYAMPPSAETCGATKSIIGSWFAARRNRTRVILTSKICGPGLDWVWGGDARIDRKNIQLALEASLKHLQTDTAIERYIELANRHGFDVCQMALAFFNSRPLLTSRLIGATIMEQLKTNIASIELILPNEVLKEIEAIRREYPMPF